MLFRSIDSYQAVFDLIIASAAVVAIVVSTVKFLDRSLEKKIVKEIREATTQIQPNANGGKSLSDLHKKVDALADAVCDLKENQIKLENELRKVEEEMEK